MPQIIGLLQAQPQPQPVAGKFPDPEGHVRRDWMGAGRDPVQLLPRNSKSPRGFADGQSDGRKNIFRVSTTSLDRASQKDYVFHSGCLIWMASPTGTSKVKISKTDC